MIVIKSQEELEKLLRQSDQLVVIHFWSQTVPQCQQIDDVLIELAKDKDLNVVKFVKVDVNSLPQLSEKFRVSSVPTCLLVVNKTVVDMIDGADVPLLTKKVKEIASKVSSGDTQSPIGSSNLEARLKSVINKAPVMVFMKGNPEAPRCGFSRTLVSILNETNISYETFDILEDEEVRQGLKAYSNWPTFPQIYVKGNLIGGLDIIKELKEDGELEETLKG